MNVFTPKKIGLAGVALLLVAGLAFVLTRPAEASGDEVLWREYPATMGTITAALDGSGALKADALPHSMSATAKVEELLVKAGQRVNVGDALVRFSADGLQDQLTQQNAALAAARRALEDAKNNKTKAQLQNDLSSKEEYQTSENQYEAKKRELEQSVAGQESTVATLRATIEELRRKIEEAQATPPPAGPINEGEAAPQEAGESAGPPEEQPQATAEPTPQATAQPTPPPQNDLAALQEQLKKAEAELAAAEQALADRKAALEACKQQREQQKEQQKGSQATKGQIDSLTMAGFDNAIQNAAAEVEAKRKLVEETKALLKDPVLTARQSGVVTQLFCAPGDEVAVGKALLEIGSEAQKRIKVTVPQEDIATVQPGQPVEVQFVAYPDRTFKGIVGEKSLVPTQGGDGVSYEVYVLLDDTDAELLEGMTCSVRFVLKRVENVLTLSNKAIQLRDGKQYVLVRLPDGTQEERQVTTGFSDGRVSEIKSGLADGDIALVEG